MTQEEAYIIGEWIGNYTKWNGYQILEIAKAAFTDANYHTFVKDLQKLWDEHHERGEGVPDPN